MYTTIGKFILAIVLMFGVIGVAVQPDADLELRLQRNFGYSALSTNDIQGTFTLTATGPADLDFVVFYVDDLELGRAEETPFQIRFSTESHPLGEHLLSAVGRTTSGDTLKSAPILVTFVSAGEGFKAGMQLLIPMLVLILGAVSLSMLATIAGSKKLQQLPPGAPRAYGFAGGAICPRCRRPFSRHTLSPNLVVGKLERCPFCGKWSIVAAAPPALLRQAELAEIDDSEVKVPEAASAEDDLQKALEESRYQDL